MAENVFAVTQSRFDEPPKRIWVDGARLRNEHLAQTVPEEKPDAVCLVSSGSLLPRNQLRIESIEGQELAPGAVGEICISSDSLFEGYYNRPDLTGEVLRDGFSEQATGVLPA